jgi:predicted transcriptional regulator
MNDKEYLQEIKNDVFKQIDYSLSQGEVCDYISLEEEKVNWLIEQAGKVKLLQSRTTGLQIELNTEKAKAERYEKALKEIEQLNEYYSGNIAYRALEGER